MNELRKTSPLLSLALSDSGKRRDFNNRMFLKIGAARAMGQTKIRVTPIVAYYELVRFAA